MPSESTGRPWQKRVSHSGNIVYIEGPPDEREGKCMARELVAEFRVNPGAGSDGHKNADLALTAVNALTARDTALDAMRGAMSFYASRDNYLPEMIEIGVDDLDRPVFKSTSHVREDEGKRATAAIALADKLTAATGETGGTR